MFQIKKNCKMGKFSWKFLATEFFIEETQKIGSNKKKMNKILIATRLTLKVDIFQR